MAIEREYKNIYPMIEFLQGIVLNHVFDKFAQIENSLSRKGA